VFFNHIYSSWIFSSVAELSMQVIQNPDKVGSRAPGLKLLSVASWTYRAPYMNSLAGVPLSVTRSLNFSIWSRIDRQSLCPSSNSRPCQNSQYACFWATKLQSAVFDLALLEAERGAQGSRSAVFCPSDCWLAHRLITSLQGRSTLLRLESTRSSHSKLSKVSDQTV
jgi:hypothetical protein